MDKWHKCYDESWQGIITPESFAHPAKMSRGLTERIFKHALSESWIKPGDVVVDPFGGIGSTGIVGAAMGLRVVCVELEEKFVALGKENFELNRKAFAVNHFGHSYQPTIIQGDSRELYGLLRVANIFSRLEVIAGADCVVGSPPFIETVAGGGEAMQPRTGDVRQSRRKMTLDRDYGQTPGQLGAMKPGSVDAVVSSPPYAEEQQGGGIAKSVHGESDYPVKGGLARSKKAGRSAKGIGYSNQGQTPGNLGNLKPGEPVPQGVDAVVSSPPFENQVPCQDKSFRLSDGRTAPPQGQDGYGNSEGQLGADKGETFWQAARQIVSECHKILKPGGHAIWVVKAFVRKGAIVDFPGDWRRLCEAEGFTTVHTHHAMLVKETKHAGLFGTITETKERKSFFRRLAEKKGSPPIDYEVVICSEKL